MGFNFNKKSFSDRLAEVKNVFSQAQKDAISLNAEIVDDNKVKQIEIDAIQAKIDFNNKVKEENDRFIEKLGEILK